MAEFSRFYGRALIYDIGMGRAVGRDFVREVDFLAALFARHAGRAMRSMVELACGPGYHTREAAGRGIAATGIDLSPDMIAYAQSLAKKDGVSAAWLVGDLRDFALPEPADLIVTPFDGIDALLTNAEIVAHFRAVAQNLAPGSVYVIDNTHPRDSSPWNYGAYRYHGERDGIAVAIDWAINGPAIDAAAQVADTEMGITVTENGIERRFTDRARERFLHPQEIMALAGLSVVLEVKEFFGAYDPGVTFGLGLEATRMIAVLRRPSA